MTKLSFDAAGSTVTIETRAKGMLAKLAHDLSIEACGLHCNLTVEGDRATITLEAPVSELVVRGVRKGDSVDTRVLSSADKSEIETKLRREVLRSTSVVAKLGCQTSLDAGIRVVAAEGTVEIGARSAPASASVRLEVSERRVTALARLRVNMPALGITPPKGPLGAFRVDDDVDVVVHLEFQRDG